MIAQAQTPPSSSARFLFVLGFVGLPFLWIISVFNDGHLLLKQNYTAEEKATVVWVRRSLIGAASFFFLFFGWVLYFQETWTLWISHRGFGAGFMAHANSEQISAGW